jgi:hypothetical protein
MKRIIIGFCGYAGAGKDTAAAAIKRAANVSGVAQRFSFADPMRAMLAALGVSHEHMTDRALKEQPVPGLGRSYRQLAQTLGTEWGRVCHGEDFWVKALAARIDRSPCDLALIPDVRFPNEAAWLKSIGGVLIRVNRPGVIPVHPHESERHVTEFQPYAELYNAESQARLEYDAVELFRNIIQVRVLDRTLQGGQP